MLKNYLIINDRQLARLEKVKERYRQAVLQPQQGLPLIFINVLPPEPPVAAQLKDPVLMCKVRMDRIRPHLQMEDDSLPMVRADFGTAQVPAAFGCELYYTELNLPAAKTHVLSEPGDVYRLKKPGPRDGIYSQVVEFMQAFREMLPDTIPVQIPDIQSPFNNAHLIRGDGIFMDFYDNPAEVEALLDLVTDFMIDQVAFLHQFINYDRDWFLDWGMLWKGQARISNCSMQMISPDFYRQYVMPRDKRLLKAIRGGRMHYCGMLPDVIKDFFTIPDLHGFDGDPIFHDLWKISAWAPPAPVINLRYTYDAPEVKRLLAGDWPAKRNLIIGVAADTVEQGKDLLRRLRESAKKAYKA